MKYVPELRYKEQEAFHADRKIVTGIVNEEKNIYDRILQPAHQYFEILVKQYMAMYPRGGMLLDYGCGTGSQTLKLLEDQ